MFEYIGTNEIGPFLKEAHRMLKPKGIFVFTCYNNTLLVRIFQLFLKKNRKMTSGYPNIRMHDIKDLKKEVEKRNFSLLDIIPASFIPSNLLNIFGKNHIVSKIFLKVCILINNSLSKLLKNHANTIIIFLKKDTI